MGLLDKFKDKAGEMVDSAKESVSEATGLDVEKGLDVAGSTLDAGKSLFEAADSVTEAKDKLFGE
jgi:hypothetical protein